MAGRMPAARIALRHVALAASLAIADARQALGQPVAGQRPRDFALGQVYAISSKVLGEERPYHVYLPPSYRDTTYQARSYPVVYVLDSPQSFPLVAGYVEYTAVDFDFPDVIVVGVTSADRTRDLTPTNSTRGVDGGQDASLSSSGHGARFLRFIGTELIPAVDRDFRTTPHRTFIGHSFGGLLVLQALMEQPDMFRNYLAVDPSTWWDNGLLARRARDWSPPSGGPSLRYFQAIANEPGSRELDMRQMRVTNIAVGAEMMRHAGAALAVRVVHYDQERHVSVAAPAIHDGLRFLFNRALPSFATFLSGADAVKAHYVDAAQRLGLDPRPPESVLTGMPVYMLGNPSWRNAGLELLRLAVTTYPKSAHAHTVLGEGLLTVADTAGARASLVRALQLQPASMRARTQLQRLGAPK